MLTVTTVIEANDFVESSLSMMPTKMSLNQRTFMNFKFNAIWTNKLEIKRNV